MRHARQGRMNQGLRDELYKSDVYISELADHLGVSKSTLYQRFNRPLTQKQMRDVKQAIQAELKERGEEY